MMLGAGFMALGTFTSGFVPDIYFLYLTMGIITGEWIVNNIQIFVLVILIY